AAGRGFADLGPPPSTPDQGRGERVYAQQCAMCHGADGAGVRGAGDIYAFPPLWGPQSFNDGAGMARVSIAAAFVHAKMPLGRGGSLSVQEEFDVATYFPTKPRPVFAAKARDWPRGGTRPTHATEHATAHVTKSGRDRCCDATVDRFVGPHCALAHCCPGALR